MPKKMYKKEKDEFRKLLAAKKESIIRKLSETITESKPAILRFIIATS